MRNRLFSVCLGFKDLRRDDDVITFEHGLTVAADEESARLTAVAASAERHEGEVLFGSDAAEMTEDDLERLIEAMKRGVRDVDTCIVSSYRTRT